MPYISQDTKKLIAAEIKKQIPDLKFTAAIEHHSMLNINIRRDKNPAFSNEEEHTINEYKFMEQDYTDKQKAIIAKVIKAIKTAGNWYDHSEIQTDYFDVAFYFNIILR